MKHQPAVVHYELRPGGVELREMPVPEIGQHDVLLQVGAVSVCGSDIHQAHNTHSWPVNVPVILGHEFAGTVARVGKGVAGVREGDRVVSETAAEICGDCLMCRTGRYNLCPRRKGFGYALDGAMTSYVRVPSRCLHPIPDDLPFDRACLAEPCSVSFHAVCVNARVTPGSLVVVIGPGPIGLLCAQMAALSGASPLIVAGRAVDAERLRAAKAAGATTTVNVDEESLEEVVRVSDALGADVVIEASGASEPLQLALRLARPDGQVVKVGWSPQHIPTDINPLVQKNLHLQGSFSHTFPMWERVIHLLATGMIDTSRLVGLKTAVQDWQNAFESMRTGKVIKSVLLPDQ